MSGVTSLRSLASADSFTAMTRAEFERLDAVILAGRLTNENGELSRKLAVSEKEAALLTEALREAIELAEKYKQIERNHGRGNNRRDDN